MHDFVRNLIPYGLRTSKVLFAQGRMKFRKFVLKMLRLNEFIIFELILVHFYVVAEKTST